MKQTEPPATLDDLGRSMANVAAAFKVLEGAICQRYGIEPETIKRPPKPRTDLDELKERADRLWLLGAEDDVWGLLAMANTMLLNYEPEPDEGR